MLATIERLARLGRRALVVGSPPPHDDLSRFVGLPVTFAGPLRRADIPAALASARFGLNDTPDVFPYNRQTSIKTLEYAAAGLGIIANRYAWVQDFAVKYEVPILWLDDVIKMGPGAAERLTRTWFDPAQLAQIEWGRLLDSIGFVGFLSGLTNGNGEEVSIVAS